MDTLLIIQCIGILLTVTSGVFGILMEHPRNKKKPLSLAGKISIVILVLSGMLTIVSQVFQSEMDKNTQRKQIEANNRALLLYDAVDVTVGLRFNSTAQPFSYATRQWDNFITKLYRGDKTAISIIAPGSHTVVSSRAGFEDDNDLDMITFDDQSPLFPDKNSMAYDYLFPICWLSTFDGPPDAGSFAGPDPNQYGDTTFFLPYNLIGRRDLKDKFGISSTVTYIRSQKKILVQLTFKKAAVFVNKSALISLSDFPGKYIALLLPSKSLASVEITGFSIDFERGQAKNWGLTADYSGDKLQHANFDKWTIAYHQIQSHDFPMIESIANAATY